MFVISDLMFSGDALDCYQEGQSMGRSAGVLAVVFEAARQTCRHLFEVRFGHLQSS